MTKRAIALAAILLPACTPQQAAQTQRDVTAKTQQSVGAMNSAIQTVRTSDEQLKIRVTAAIAAQSGVNVFHVSTAVSHGVVTLSGMVDSPPVAQTIVKAAASVSGVKRVENHLRVASK